MRSILAPVLAVALTASSAFAVDNGPLPAGKPAGTHEAAMGGNGLIFVAAAVVIGVGIAVAVSNNNNNSPAVSSTGTAP